MDTVNGKSNKTYAAGLTPEIFDSLVNFSDVGLLNWHLATGEISLNKPLADLVGYNMHEIPHSANSRYFLIVEEDIPLVKECIEQCISGEQDNYKIEYRMRRKDGSVVWILENAIVCERDRNGKAIRISALVLDLSTQRLAESHARELESENRRLTLGLSSGELAKENHMLRAVATASTLIVGGFHQDYEVVLRQALKYLAENIEADRGEIWVNTLIDNNPAFYLRVGWSASSATTNNEAASSKPIFLKDIMPNYEDFVHQQDPIIARVSDLPAEMKFIPHIKNAKTILIIPIFLHGIAWGFLTFQNQTKDRLFTDSEADIMRLGGMTIASSINRNIMLKKINEARDAATESTKAKSDFVSRMSHEIRTPMNAIIGMTTIAKQTDDAERIKYCIDKIDFSSRQLLQLINDILDMSKIDADKLELNPVPFDFAEIVENVHTVLQGLMRDKKLNFAVTYKKPLEKMIIADELRMSQVLTNLMTNAVKFTPENGSINIIIDYDNISVDKIKLKVTVSDTGIGIHPDNIPKLFSSFEQADGGIAKQFGGSGLGLSICKRIVEMNGGKIWVESVLGKGSDFIFEAEFSLGGPLTQNSQKDEPTLTDELLSHNWSGKTILLAEDIEINREIVSILLADTGVSIIEAENGEIALDIFKNTSHHFDLILMDVQMPIMDGLTTTKRIRALDSDYAEQIPIIAMTANAFKEDIDACLNAGMTKHVAKPIEVDELLKAIAAYLD